VAREAADAFEVRRERIANEAAHAFAATLAEPDALDRMMDPRYFYDIPFRVETQVMAVEGAAADIARAARWLGRKLKKVAGL
jgi:hypothetical protein